MIFVDTSIWIDYFRGRDASLRTELDQLLDDDHVAVAIPVRIELLSGARTRDLTRLGRVLSALATFRPSAETWKRMESWVRDARDQGYQFGMGDLLIASIAKEHQGRVWSRDRDFENMSSLGLIELHRPSPSKRNRP